MLDPHVCTTLRSVSGKQKPLQSLVLRARLPRRVQVRTRLPLALLDVSPGEHDRTRRSAAPRRLPAFLEGRVAVPYQLDHRRWFFYIFGAVARGHRRGAGRVKVPRPNDFRM